MRCHRARRQAGFTIIETLVAFTVLAAVLAVLMQNLGIGLRNQHVSTHYLDALSLAESRLADFDHLPQAVPERVAGEGPGAFRWEVAFLPQPLPEDPTLGTLTSDAELYTVVATVSWPDAGRRRSLSLATQRAAAPDNPMRNRVPQALTQ